MQQASFHASRPGSTGIDEMLVTVGTGVHRAWWRFYGIYRGEA
jgi:hypothetical protein